jgi:hypothetical protein
MSGVGALTTGNVTQLSFKNTISTSAYGTQRPVGFTQLSKMVDMFDLARILGHCDVRYLVVQLSQNCR